MSNKSAPFVKLIEQPARCALRFRYECEGRSAGSIPGSNSTPENKSYPTIQIMNYRGPAVVVVSCVTKDLPYRPHPHNLVGKEGCKKGVCTMVINNPEMICSFTSLGIQCVKRKDVEESLKLRESIKVDPFRTGFSHKTQASNIDLNVVRLCFQVFIEGPEKDKFTVPLPPIVCEPIYDKKAMSELVITKLSHCSASVQGGTDMILLCDRVTKDDIQVRFYEERNNQLVWEAYGEFQPNDVHKQVAICFRTPRYFDETIQQPVLVQIQMRRPSDSHTSDPRPFQLIPREVDPDGLSRKRQKLQEHSVDRYIRENLLLSPSSMPNKSPSPVPSPMEASMSVDEPLPRVPPNEFIGVPRMASKVKTELQETANSQPYWQQGHKQDSQLHEMLPPAAPFNFGQQLLTQNYQPNVHSISSTAQVEGIPSTSSSSFAFNLRKEQLVTSLRSAEFAQAVSNFAPQASGHEIRNPLSNLNDNNITEKLDSLDLDIDPSDLMNDINFNNLMVMMDSGNNIQFNSSGNIAEPSATASLNTPQLTDDSGKNILASAAQMARLQNELLMHSNQISKSNQENK